MANSSSPNTGTLSLPVPIPSRSDICAFDSAISATNHLQLIPNHHHHNHHQQQQQQQNQQSPNFFNPISNHDTDNNHNHNHDLVWPRPGLQSDPNFPLFGTLTSSSPSISGNSDFMATPTPHQAAAFPSPSIDRSPLPPPNTIKNPKKRTRASRRAPTTVLTTDVTNFRQMVQEFTGIPASSFPTSPYSRSFDLLSAASALRSGSGFHPLRPFYPPRPSKLPSPFSSTNPLTIGNDETSIGGNSSTNYHQLLNLNFHHHHHHQQQQRSFPSLQLGGSNAAINLGNLSGFLSREGRRRIDSDGGGGVELGNCNAAGFDGAGGISTQELSGYNLNNVGDQKGMENDNARDGGGGGGSR